MGGGDVPGAPLRSATTNYWVFCQAGASDKAYDFCLLLKIAPELNYQVNN